MRYGDTSMTNSKESTEWPSLTNKLNQVQLNGGSITGFSQTAPPISKELPVKEADISEPLATFQRVSYGLHNLTDSVEEVDNWIRSAEFCFGPVSDQVKLTAVSSKIYGEKARTLLCLDIKTWSQFKEELFDVLDVHSCQLKLEEVIWAKKRYTAFTPRKAIAQAKIDCAVLRRAPKVPANIDKRVAEALLSIFPGKVVSHIDSELPVEDVLSQLKSVIKTSMVNPDYDGWADKSATEQETQTAQQTQAPASSGRSGFYR
ncbi:hypothetical protein GGI07_003812 [Coemansia sp. Benny D115]|nr:hypothetical protein GGI07_003812 [Coemansia sp. Benny D115]